MIMSIRLNRKTRSTKSQEWNFRQEWDRARAAATTPRERAEIDAIFARYDEDSANTAAETTQRR